MEKTFAELRKSSYNVHLGSPCFCGKIFSQENFTNSKDIPCFTQSQFNEIGLRLQFQNLGFLSDAEGDRKQAREYYENVLEIRKKNVKRTPDDLQALRDLSGTYNNLGFLSDAEGDSKQAKEYYENALEIREKIVERTPDDIQALSDLSATYYNLLKL